jgi:hypothetical protein
LKQAIASGNGVPDGSRMHKREIVAKLEWLGGMGEVAEEPEDQSKNPALT